MSAITTFFRFICEHQIQIPIIQRDYAQGREDEKTSKIRNDFLDDISSALTTEGKTLDFDFVYGTVIKDYIFQPIDGQQRLTTLWLLHWYIANRAQKLYKDVIIKHSTTQENCILIDGLSNKNNLSCATSETKLILSEILKKFSYQTRASSRRFCEKLIDFKITDNESISQSIKNQIWFIESWNLDPTVKSMLTMIDSIHAKFKGCDANIIFKNLFFKEKIVFHKLYMEDFELEDELYIKMNSRGKPLTEFENFKAEFIENIPEEKREDITQKLDGPWLDFFWNEAGNDPQKTEKAMYNYFKFVSELEFGDVTNEKEHAIHINILSNSKKLEFLINSLDVLSEKTEDTDSKVSISGYIEKHICKERINENYIKASDVILPIYEDIRIFQNLIDGENVTAYQKNIVFALLLQRIEKKESCEELRHIRNICLHANLSKIQEYIYILITSEEDLLKKIMNRKSQSPFMEHEIRKLELNNNPKVKKEDLYYLEDHDFLRGKLYVFEESVENTTAFSELILNKVKNTTTNFEELFHSSNTFEDYNSIFRIMLAKVNFIPYQSRKSGQGYFHYFANSYDTWKPFFIEQAKNFCIAFQHLLSTCNINNIISEANKLAHYHPIEIYDFHHYMIKYPTMSIKGFYPKYRLYFWKGRFLCHMRHDKSLRDNWIDPYFYTILSLLPEFQNKVNDNKVREEVGLDCYGNNRQPLLFNEFKLTLVPDSPSFKIIFYSEEEYTQNKIDNYTAYLAKIEVIKNNNEFGLVFPNGTPNEAIIEVADNEDRIERAVAVISKLLSAWNLF